MSLSSAWAEDLGNIELSYLYRILNRLIGGEHYADFLPTKGEQDVAWAVKHEYEERREAGEDML